MIINAFTDGLVSIVIPVYKVENYLEKCINSVISQSYNNLEIILVDDGSPDYCPEICDKAAVEDSRIKVIHKKNGGLSDARNVGVNIARGEFCIFVDSDDWIDYDFIESLMHVQKKYQADIVEIGVKYIYSDRIVKSESEDIYIYSNKEACHKFLDRSLDIKSMVQNKLYRTSIIKEIPFAVGRLHEDMYFTYQALYASTRFVRVECAKYNYRQEREGSIMSSPIGEKNIKDQIYGYEQRNEFFKVNREIELLEKSKASYYRALLHLICRAWYGLRDNKELYDFIVKKIEENNRDILSNKYMKKAKLAYYAYLINPKLLFRIYYVRYKDGNYTVG